MPHTIPIVIKPGAGRKYDMGSMQSVFLADEHETAEKYSISEWWLDPHSAGPGAHKHEMNDEVFYVLEGTAAFLIGEEWISAEKGSFLRIPAGTIHDFANHTEGRTGVLNFFIPGGFERNMPAIVKWFEEHKS